MKLKTHLPFPCIFLLLLLGILLLACQPKETSNLPIPRFEEIELNTGLGHGFLFKPLPEWIVPTIDWAKAEG